jgi:branched-chain amino acid transport system permease protein
MTGMAAMQRLSVSSLLAPIIIAAIAAVLPRFGVSSYVQILVYYTAYYLTLGQAWNLMSGMTGYVSFAHGALAGIGAYATVMALNAGWPLVPAILAGPASAVLGSLIIGATSLRLRGTAFTFTTLFFQALALQVLRKIPATGGPGGLALQEILPIWLPQTLMIALACAATIVMLVVRRSRTGIRLLAIKGDETAALSLGIASARLKLALFCASAAIAGAAGAVHGLFTASLYPDVVFAVDVSLIALAVPLIGGVATVSGPLMGAVFYIVVGETLAVYAPNFQVAAVGVMLLTVILFMPAGLMPFVMKRLRRQSHVAARPLAVNGRAE